MASFDLMPPAMPGEQPQKKASFLKKFFFKEEENQPSPSSSSMPAPSSTQDMDDPIDLDEIKRRLQLDDDMPGANTSSTPAPTSAPQAPSAASVPIDEQDLREMSSHSAQMQESHEEVPIPDWTADAAPQARAPAQEESALPVESWDAEPTVEPKTSAAPAAPTHEESPWASPENFHDDLASHDAALGGEHHDAIDEHFAPIAHKTAQLLLGAKDASTQKEEAAATVADWHLQEREVPAERYFILRNGSQVRSLRELGEALEYIDDETFAHHLNEYRNDFANWIQGVIHNPQLAEVVRLAQTREEVAAALQQHHEETKQRVKEHTKKAEQTVRKLKEITQNVDKIKEQLTQKAQAIENERRAASQRAKEALDRELQTRLAQERAQLKEERTQLKKERASTQKLQADAQRAFAEHEKLTKDLEEKRQKLLEREQALAQQKEAFAQEQQTAAPLLKQAKKVQEDLEKITRHQKQVQEHLREITQHEGAIERAEAALKQRETKITQDLTRVHEQQERLGQLKQEHATREQTVATLENDAKAVMAQAQQRIKDAVAREKQATASVAAETKKLNDVRRKIEFALKGVIKNKQQTMHAKQLREHLEKAILETKQSIVQEHEQMRTEEFASMRKTQAEITPVGQPGTPLQEDVLEAKDGDLYKKIESARSALDAGNLVTAKRIYNELRDAFPKQELQSSEKNALYMAIRELYDDIHLAMLEQ